ncbi:putative reverse transcriptase domain-containing protein [Tanacetum coccineum]
MEDHPLLVTILGRITMVVARFSGISVENLGIKKRDCRGKAVATSVNAQPIVTCYGCGEKGHTRDRCPKRNNLQGEEARGHAYVIKDAKKQQGPNVVTGTFLLNNRYATILFDSGSDKSFVNTSFSHLIDINPVRLDTSYEVELADGRVARTFDMVIGIDWLVEQDAVIVCGRKVVHISVKSKILVVEGDKGASRLKVVFPNDLLGLPPPRQVEFRIELVPGAAPVARAPYRLTPFEMKELADQLQELSEKGFICPSSSSWRALALFGLSVYSKIDLRTGYHQLRIMEEDNSITAYRTREEEHGEHPKTILELLKKEQLYAKFLKYDFWLEYVKFLGHVIDSKGIHVDPAKSEAIRNWVAPTTPTEVRQFLGANNHGFIVGLSRTPSGYDSIWVIVDRLTKSVHLLPVKMVYSMEKLTQLYLKDIVYRYGVPILIISDRDSMFASRFWRSLQRALGTQLDLSIAYHSETDDQSERIMQTLEDMLQACVIDFGGSWDRHFPLV